MKSKGYENGNRYDDLKNEIGQQGGGNEKGRENSIKKETRT